MVATHPIYDRDSLVMLGEHVTTDAGTGCVHTAPGHGEDDFYIGQKYGLDVLCPVDDKGVMTAEAPGFEGLFYDKANKAITEKLEEVGALLKLSYITHSYPHDWRTKKPIIFRATAQWFASIKDFREDLLEAVKETKWVPAWGETRLFNMVRDRGDWCISRQRAWGVPIPVFYGENGEPIITDETIEHVSALFREHGSNVWFEREAKDLLPEGFTHQSSPNGIFTKETDIMDVWFDSGSSHQAVLLERDDLQRPADLYLEGWLRQLRMRSRQLLQLFLITALLHQMFASYRWFYRYEVYLVALGVIAVSIAAWDLFANVSVWTAAALLLLASFLAIPLFMRAYLSFTGTPRAMADIYHQQYQMAQFFRAYYPQGHIALNDIGAVSFYADPYLTDLAGLGSTEIARARLGTLATGDLRYDFLHNAAAQATVRINHVEVVAVYDDWFGFQPGHIPPGWIRAGAWSAAHKTVIGGSIVSFYGVGDENAARLQKNLAAFHPRLPQ